MRLSYTKTFYTIFHCVLIFATVGISIYGIHKYNLDQSVSMVDFKRFHSSENDLYPSLSLCFADAISKEKMKQKHKGRKKVIYTSYLSGFMVDEYLNKEYLNINYEDVAIQADEYLNEVFIKLGNGTKMIHKLSKNFTWVYNANQPGQRMSLVPRIQSKNTGPLHRCFTIDAPYIPEQAIEYVRLSVNRSVFQSGFLTGFYTLISYPNQILRAGFTTKDNWKKKYRKSLSGKSDGYKDTIFEIEVDKINVINYRDKPEDPCNSDWLNDDPKIYNHLVQDFGCRAPYLNGKENLCIGQKNMTKLNDRLKRMHFSPSSMDIHPCRVIRDLRYYAKIVTKDAKKNSFAISIRYPEYFAEVKHVKEITLESLLGNIGGYVGVFLGYSLLQMPTIVMAGYSMLKTMILQKLGSDIKCGDLEEGRMGEQQKNGKEISDVYRIHSEMSVIRQQLKNIKFDVASLKQFNVDCGKKIRF